MDKKSEVNEWIKFADNDLLAAESLNKIHPKPVEIICYHCQQSAEKYLKAYLIFKETEFEKTHNLNFILSLCIEKNVDFEIIKKEITRLNPYSVHTRYPSSIEINEEDCKSALIDIINIKNFILDFLKKEGYEI
jgi:HEPN domain-containing protein